MCCCSMEGRSKDGRRGVYQKGGPRCGVYARSFSFGVLFRVLWPGALPPRPRLRVVIKFDICFTYRVAIGRTNQNWVWIGWMPISSKKKRNKAENENRSQKQRNTQHFCPAPPAVFFDARTVRHKWRFFYFGCTEAGEGTRQSAAFVAVRRGLDTKSRKGGIGFRRWYSAPFVVVAWAWPTFRCPCAVQWLSWSDSCHCRLVCKERTR